MRLGIDFGTSSSSAAFIVDGHVETVIDPSDSEASMFSSSIFLRPPQEFVVGQVADKEQWTEPRHYRHQLKRDLGREGPVLGCFGVVELVAQILKKLKDDADAMMRSQDQRAFTGAVIGVPITYGRHQKEQIRQAARLAGFVAEEVDLVPEPVAAALYYVNGGQIHEQKAVQEDERILIYDLGGGTFDAAFIQKQGDTYQSLATPAGLEVCGGTDFDQAIYLKILEKFPQLKALVAIDPSAPESEQTTALLNRSTLGSISRDIKHQLSNQERVIRPIQLLGLPKHLNYELTRQDFLVQVEISLAKTFSCCEEMLRQSNFSWEDVDRIVLVGGSCHIPYVADYLSKETQRPVAKSLRLESVVRHGLAYYAAHHPVYTVSPQEGLAEFSSLTAALKQARRPARIVLYPGVHQEQQVVIEQEDLTIIGAGAREQVVLETQGRVGVKMACKTATLEKLTLHHQLAPARNSGVNGRRQQGMAPGTSWQYAYRGGGTAGNEPTGGVVITQGHLKLKECVLEAANQVIVIQGPGSKGELLQCQINGGATGGLAVYNGALADLSECAITRSQGNGILVSQQQSQLILDRCHISENAGGGLLFRNGAQGNLSNCRIEQNTLIGLNIQSTGMATLRHCQFCFGQEIGLSVEGAGQVQAEECVFENNARPGILLSDKGSQATLLKCQIQNGQAAGLEIVKGSRGILEDCQFAHNAGPALRVEGEGSHATVNRGAVHANAYTGVLLSKGGQGEFRALTLSDNAGPALRIAHAGSKAALEDCVIIQNGAGLVVEDRGEGTHTRCQIEKNWLNVYVEPASKLGAH
jgi:actin-like ATPase involved in cell morphogenesis